MKSLKSPILGTQAKDCGASGAQPACPPDLELLPKSNAFQIAHRTLNLQGKVFL